MKKKNKQNNNINKEKKNNDKKKENKEINKENKEIKEEIKYKQKILQNNDYLLNTLTVIIIITSIIYFIMSLIKCNELGDIINTILLFILTILVLFLSFISKKKNKISYITLLVILIIDIFNILTLSNFIKLPSNSIKDYVGSNMSEVIKFTNKYNIKLVQNYEYSDYIDEYHIINQNIKPGTRIKDIKELKIIISEGSNPYKDILIPNMIGFNSEDVIKFIKENKLTNVDIEYIKDNEKYDSLIKQSIKGNMKRNDKITFTFSLGNEDINKEIRLKDLTNLNKFDLEFYLKKNNIKYEYIYEFSNSIDRNHVIKQSINASNKFNTASDILKITISKGNKIIVPDLVKYSVDDLTKWVIDNNLKIEFSDRYDDNINKNNIVEVNYKKDDVVEEDTLIKVVLSKGPLVMEKFNNYNSFREWADKYNIKYEEKHEFNDNVPIGSIIKYSYNDGDTIKNNDIIIVYISDGKKITVPNLYGLNKNDAINKLRKNSLNYNFVYKYSDKTKGTVIGQSIRSNSSVSSGTTITLTISNGNRPLPPPKPKCVPKTYIVTRALNNIFSDGGGFDTVKNKLLNHFASNYPEVKIVIQQSVESGKTSGSYVGGIGPGSKITSCNSTPYTIIIAK